MFSELQLASLTMNYSVYSAFYADWAIELDPIYR